MRSLRYLSVLFIVLYNGLTVQAAKQTNFLFFLVDDMGWADIGANGSTFHETPHIDRLAKSGMRFTQGYAAGSVCSPTRASIMTGKHPVRVDITDWIPGQSNRPTNPLLHPEDRHSLPLEEVTLAEALKQHGYQTFFAGKWHLGKEGEWPTDQGFDINIGGHHKGSPPGGYYAPWTNPALKAKRKGEYLTERLTEESAKFLESRDKAKPFLLYLSYYNIHTPIQPYKKRIDHYKSKAEKSFTGPTPFEVEHDGKTRTRQDNPALASMVAAVDDSVGALLDKLEELKLDDNTVVIFFSDNGGLSTLGRIGPGCNVPLRAGKGWLYEGGIREPTLIRAPGITRPGSVSHKPMISMDFFPTMLDLAGLPSNPSCTSTAAACCPNSRATTPASARFTGITPTTTVPPGNRAPRFVMATGSSSSFTTTTILNCTTWPRIPANEPTWPSATQERLPNSAPNSALGKSE